MATKFGGFASVSILCGAVACFQSPAAAQVTDEPAVTERGDVVVVTARKREESLQDVPLSVTAVSGDMLEESGYSNLADVARTTPNVYFEAGDRTRPYIYIRGIGTRTYDPGTNSSVGIFVDGVYQPRLATLDMDLMDVERVEILRGPQGTLYGKNTIAGAMSVVSRDPSDNFEAKLSGELGAGEIDGDTFANLWGRISGPVVNDFANASLAFSRRTREGYTRVNGRDYRGGSEDSWAVRANTLIEFSPSTTLRLTAFATDADGPPLVLRVNPIPGASPFTGVTAPGVLAPAPIADPYTAGSDLSDVKLSKETSGVSATLDWLWGDVKFTSISAYQKMTLGEVYDFDGSSLAIATGGNDEDAEFVSEELRAAWSDDRLSWLLGLYYGEERSERVDHFVNGLDSLAAFLGGGPVLWDFGVNFETKSLAAFGQLQYDLTDTLSVTVGARYSEDKRTAAYNTRSSTPPVFVAPFTSDESGKWDSVDPMASISYDITDDVMAYATWSTGYKSGAFQFIATSPLVAHQVINPENVESTEIGIRSMLFDQRLRLNASVFHMDYSDLQTARLVPGPGGVSVALVSNAAASTIDGLELETHAVLDDYFSLDVNYAYLDARYDSYVFGPGLDFSGNRMQRAPENTFSAALSYSRDFDIGKVDARVAYSWRDSLFFEADNNTVDPNSSDPELGLWDASIGLDTGAVVWSLWGTNLSDERYRRAVLNSTGFAQREVWAEPRTIGLRATIKFQ